MDELADSFSQFGKVFRSDYKNTYDYKSRSIQYLISKTIKGVRAAINDFKPDVIHVNKQNVEDGLDLLVTLDQSKLPYVTTIHITQTEKSLGAWMGGLRDLISRKILQKAKSGKWITISPNRALDLVKFLGSADKVIMIPNAVKIEHNHSQDLKKEMRKSLNVPENNLVVISVGRLEQQKDPLKFIDWAVHSLKTNSNLNFYWVGDGRLRSSFEKAVNNYNLGTQIKCTGWQKDVHPFYAMADIYVHTATFEGLPFSLLEAMSWRLPCVVSEELYEDLTFPKDTIHKGLDALELFVNQKDRRTKAGNQAYDYVTKTFSIDAITNSYLSVYKMLVND